MDTFFSLYHGHSSDRGSLSQDQLTNWNSYFLLAKPVETEVIKPFAASAVAANATHSHAARRRKKVTVTVC